MNRDVTSDKWQVTRTASSAGRHVTRHSSPVTRSAFTLVEVLVVMVLLSLIVLVLMAVFNSAQTAFRTGVTQTDVLEGGRATMDLMAADVRNMAPSDGYTNRIENSIFIPGAVNFCAYTDGGAPLVQSLAGSSAQRVNTLERFFILSRNNVNGQDIWTGTGYVVDTASASPLYPLYRFSASTNSSGTDPALLFNAFFTEVASGQWTNMSHLMDGVVNLSVRAYDLNGTLMTANVLYSGGQFVTNRNVLYFAPASGEIGFEMFSNTLPATVEIEMGVLEDRTLQRAGSLGASTNALAGYLAQQAGAVHIFRQRVSIPNFDPSAYQ